jgi:RNA polymerase sigma-70 factor (ECF subfamily)
MSIIAEEATADAFMLALRTWPTDGVPHSMEAWLLTAARRRAIDRVRRAGRLRDRLERIASAYPDPALAADADAAEPIIADDELRLIVLCCRPALDAEVQVALTMRLACGIPTASIAAAFLVPTATMAARLTRAKKRIAGSGIGIELPDDVAVEERMEAVRRTIHLACSMGHTAGTGETSRDNDLAGVAHRMARTLHDLRPDDSEAVGLLVLIELSEARAPARLVETTDQPEGGLTTDQVLLADMDRATWDRSLIDSGLRRLSAVAAGDRVGRGACQRARASHPRRRSAAGMAISGIVGPHHSRARILHSPRRPTRMSEEAIVPKTRSSMPDSPWPAIIHVACRCAFSACRGGTKGPRLDVERVPPGSAPSPETPTSSRAPERRRPARRDGRHPGNSGRLTVRRYPWSVVVVACGRAPVTMVI